MKLGIFLILLGIVLVVYEPTAISLGLRTDDPNLGALTARLIFGFVLGFWAIYRGIKRIIKKARSS